MVSVQFAWGTTPHTVGAYTDVTRRLLVQSTPDAESHILEDLAGSIACEVDRAAINGLGSGGVPLGLLQRGLSTVAIAADSGDGGAVTFDDLVGLELAVGVANGDSEADAKMAFLTSPAGRSKLRRTSVGGATQTSARLWCRDVENGESVLGYPAAASTSVLSANTKGNGTALTLIAYGDFHSLIINLFSGIDLLVDRYTLAANTKVRMSAFQDVDVAVLRASSFAVLNAAVTV